MAVENERHERLRGLLGVYALGALDAAERADVEAHLTECKPCRHAAITRLESAALLLDDQPLQVPASVWDSIVERVARRRAVTPAAPTRAPGRAGTG
jgi:hypothetical protein